MSLDATAVNDPTELQGRRDPDPGIYHGIVNEMDPSQDKLDAVLAHIEILAGKSDKGDIAEQRGRTLRHAMFFQEGNYTDSHLRFAVITGVIEAGQKTEQPQWGKAVNKQLVFRVEKRESRKEPGKVYSQIANWGLDIWPVGHEEVRDVPKDREALALLQAAGGSPAPQSAAAASGSREDWSNI